jgi:DNA-3-methyladenine glycosylase
MYTNADWHWRNFTLKKLDQAFYERPAIELAADLMGKIIVRTVRRKEFRARIVETEVYIGSHDLASHASKGRTTRTEIMFGPAGRAYVYLVYGIHDMFNIVAGQVGDPQAVLIYFNFSAMAMNCSRAVCRSSAISCASTSGAGRSSESSRLLSRSQKMSRFTLSRFIRSS